MSPVIPVDVVNRLGNHSMRGQCWWKGGIENELAFSMDAMQFGPLKIGKDNADVKTYQFFLHQGAVRRVVDGFGLYRITS